MKTTYEVWSQTESGEVLETRRTDPRAAAQDRDIIASILHRKARVVESPPQDRPK